MQITNRSLTSLEFHLQWSSPEASHTEVLYAPNANIWRDLFPSDLGKQLLGKKPGKELVLKLGPDKGIPDRKKEHLQEIRRGQFLRRRIHGREIEPRFGRFYPKGLLAGLPGVFPQDIRPFRCIGLSPKSLEIDLNHPLAGRNGELTIRIVDVWEKEREMGGQCRVWMDDLLEGPGMQIRWNGQPTDFFAQGSFSRPDETDDFDFYAQARPVSHVDSMARQHIRDLHARLLRTGMTILDLMSSTESHLPDELSTREVVGLGLNEEELASNPVLTSTLVHDLNAQPVLPLAADSFDAVLCSLSVEYLVRPKEVFADIARVLKPGGIFLVTFSHRWFPPKVIRLWTELHEFERVGLVLDFFLRCGQFTDLETISLRGWPRPMDERDRYYPLLQDSDPLYGVWGRVK